MNETEQELRGRINFLEKQIKELEAELYRATQETGDMLNRQTRMLQYNNANAAEKLEQDYRAAFAIAVENISRSHSEEIEKHRRAYNDMEKRMEALQAEAEEERAKLYEYLGRIETFDKSKQTHAEQSLRALLNEIKTAEGTAAEFFYPRKINIYHEAAKRASDLMQQQLFTEAVAVSESAILGVKRLKNDTDRKTRLFESYFERYEALFKAAYDTVSSEAAHTMLDENGDILYNINNYGLDYWSDGVYFHFLQILQEHGSLISQINSNGIRILKEQGEDPIGFIREQSNRIMNLPECLRISISYSFSALDCYENSITTIKNKAVAVLSKQGFLFDGTTFGKTNPELRNTPGYKNFYDNYLRYQKCIEEGERADFREERRLTFKKTLSNGKKEYVILRILPVRTGITVACRMELTVKSEEMQNELTAKLTELLAAKRVGPLQAVSTITQSDTTFTRAMHPEEVLEMLNT